MLPVAIFRHALTEGPGYFAEFLDQHHIPWQLIAIDTGAAIPSDVRAFSGLVFMGGPMSVNDELPWIEPVLQRIRDAVAADIPVLGHCLGGQLMSKALGGSVGGNPVKEIGWGQVTPLGTAGADWFGGNSGLEVFHWHGETFSIPPQAQCSLENSHCANQAFVLHDKHLGMQCHIEMTAAMIHEWCEIGAEEMATANSPAVQTREQIYHGIRERLSGLHHIAAAVYTRWIRALPR